MNNVPLSLSVEPVTDLFYLLRRQYHGATIVTVGNCPICHKQSRGSGWCADCVSEEIHRRGYHEIDIKNWRDALEKLHIAAIQAASAFETLESSRKPIARAG